MIGPTGVGKTEIARRLARLAGCPFVKVEASKYTEVGYVGRDVESMVRDLVETSIDMVREEKLDEVADRAEQAAEEACWTCCFRRKWKLLELRMRTGGTARADTAHARKTACPIARRQAGPAHGGS